MTLVRIREAAWNLARELPGPLELSVDQLLEAGRQRHARRRGRGAAAEPGAIQIRGDPNSQALIQVDQGAPGNNAVAKVTNLGSLAALPRATAHGGR